MNNSYMVNVAGRAEGQVVQNEKCEMYLFHLFPTFRSDHCVRGGCVKSVDGRRVWCQRGVAVFMVC